MEHGPGKISEKDPHSALDLMYNINCTYLFLQLILYMCLWAKTLLIAQWKYSKDIMGY